MKKIRRRGRKILSILLSMTMAAGMMLTGITPGTNEVKAASSLTSADFLKTNGTSIRKNYGNGEKVCRRLAGAGELDESYKCTGSEDNDGHSGKQIWYINKRFISSCV